MDGLANHSMISRNKVWDVVIFKMDFRKRSGFTDRYYDGPTHVTLNKLYTYQIDTIQWYTYRIDCTSMYTPVKFSDNRDWNDIYLNLVEADRVSC